MVLGNFSVTFEHHKDARRTLCSVKDESDETLASGEAKMFHKDKVFNKAQGRKVALQKALRSSSLGRADRSAIWTDYWSKTKSPSKIKY